jgi:hypothetical protein
LRALVSDWVGLPDRSEEHLHGKISDGVEDFGALGLLPSDMAS